MVASALAWMSEENTVQRGRHSRYGCGSRCRVERETTTHVRAFSLPCTRGRYTCETMPAMPVTHTAAPITSSTTGMTRWTRSAHRPMATASLRGPVKPVLTDRPRGFGNGSACSTSP